MNIISEEFAKKARYFRIGASLMNIGFTDKQVMKLILLYEGVSEKGGAFSVNDAVDIDVAVEKYNGAYGLPKETEEPQEETHDKKNRRHLPM